MFADNKAYISALSGLRGFAALWVISFHLCSFFGNPKFVFLGFNLFSFFYVGHYGVDLFFVLSGCLLGRPFILAMLQKTQAPEWRQFWLNRCRRILPAYWFQLILLILLAGWGTYDLQTLLRHFSLSFNIIKNSSEINPVYWSLPVEWNFYLMIPFIALLFRSSKRFLLVVFFTVIFAIAFRVLCWQALFRLNAEGLWLFRLIIQLPARIDQFMIGMLAAWLSIQYQNSLMRWSLPISIGGIVVIAITAALTLRHGDVLDNSRVPWAYFQQTFAAIGFAGLIVAACVSQKGLSRFWSTRFMQFCGLVSYSLYLWHFPIGQYWLQHIAPGLVFFIVFVGTTFFTSYLSWRLIEQKFISKNTTVHRK